MSNSVTTPLTSQKKDWAQFCARIDSLVEESYGKVMSPHHRDLVKRIAKGESYEPPRPFIHRLLQRTAREVVAVVSAGQTL